MVLFIAYISFLRIVRICSKPENREKQFMKLKELLENRGYSERTISSAIDRARKIPRQVALKRVLRRQTEKRPVFAVTYDPRLPPIQSIQAKHWRAMVNHLLLRIRGKGILRTT